MEIVRFLNEYMLASLLPWRLLKIIGVSHSTNKYLLNTYSVPSRQQQQGSYSSLEKAPDIR